MQARGLRGLLSRLTWPLLFLAVLATLAMILPGHHKHADRQLGTLDANGSGGGGGGISGSHVTTIAARRQLERQQIGRAQRTYIKGAAGCTLGYLVSSPAAVTRPLLCSCGDASMPWRGHPTKQGCELAAATANAGYIA